MNLHHGERHMGHPLREQKEDAIYELTNRTLQQIYSLKPDEEVNAIILGLLAKMAWRYGVEIFAFVFMSNHFHILARCRSLQLHLFMRDFQSQLARKLNKKWNRTGTFWERRYTAIEVLDDDALIDRLRYTVCNPCESGLVRHPRAWPGLCSWDIHESGEPLIGKIVNRELYWALKRSKAGKEMTEKELIEKATEEYPLEIAKLPKWEDLDDDSYHKRIIDECHGHAGELAEARGRPYMGREDVLATKWYQRPDNPKRAPRPACHTSDLELRQEHRETRRQVVDRYRQAVGKWREGKFPVHFPQGTIPPGHQFCVGGKCTINTAAPPR